MRKFYLLLLFVVIASLAVTIYKFKKGERNSLLDIIRNEKVVLEE